MEFVRVTAYFLCRCGSGYQRSAGAAYGGPRRTASWKAMKVIDECKNPPGGMLRHVRRSIGWIFPGDFEGIYSLRLIDELSPRNEAASESWYKAAARHGHAIRGWYKPKKPSTKRPPNDGIKPVF
jgi:hypothetical protein